jgi:hypothetical protein
VSVGIEVRPAQANGNVKSHVDKNPG